MSKKLTATVAGVVVLGVLVLGALVIAVTHMPSDSRIGAMVRDGSPSATGDVGINDGMIATGESISPFADDHPAIANLDADLRAAMQDAARDAISDGVDFVVTSGWRSASYQQALLDAAVIEYGSAEAAGEFVLPPEKSRHVTGGAVDIGRTDANSWLSQHGSDYGLCQIYGNEMWHFELATSPGGQCPAQLSHAGDLQG